MKKKVFVIEDEKHNREYLIELLEENFAGKLEICGSAASSLESLEFLKANHVDVLFLDIELSDGQVFDLLKQIDHRKYHLIFVTGYSEHAIRAIKFSAADYLLKPIVTEELLDAVKRVLNSDVQGDPILDDMIEKKKFELPEYLIINNKRSIEKIPFEKIAYLEADGIYTQIFHEGRKTISSKPLGVYESVLSAKLFNRCHKSYIVNRFYIKRIEKGRGMEITLYDGKQIPVAVRKKEEFAEWFKG